jgi:hypothetical protein
MAVQDIYKKHVRWLPTAQRLKLVALLADQLAAEVGAYPARHRRSILELAGLGKEIWEGVDAQEYVNKLRDEWDERVW